MGIRRTIPVICSRLPWAAVWVLALFCQPLLAWPPDLHRFIVEAALEISPAAAARIPPRYLSDLLTAAEGDRRTEDIRAPFQEAHDSLKYFLSTPKEPWSRNRAMGIGRILNLVSHASVARDQYGPARTDTLFPLREIVVFRIRRDLSPSLRESLSSYLSTSSWSEDPSMEMAEKFRDAANLVADALLRLPGPPEEEFAPGPALFIYDPASSGMAATPIFWGPLTTVNYSTAAGLASAMEGPAPTPKPAKKASGKSAQRGEEPAAKKGYDGIVKRRSKFWRVFELPGVSPLEFMFRQTDAEYTVRILFFNNSETCFSEFVTKSTKWKQNTPFVLPAFSFRSLEFKIPKSALNEEDVEFYLSEAKATCPEAVPGAYLIKSYKPVASSGTVGPNFAQSQLLTRLPAIEEPIWPVRRR